MRIQQMHAIVKWSAELARDEMMSAELEGRIADLDITLERWAKFHKIFPVSQFSEADYEHAALLAATVYQETIRSCLSVSPPSDRESERA